MAPLKHAALLAMPVLAMAAAIPDNAGILIVGGEAADFGDFPYIISLSIKGTHSCGGALLNANTVITAAHCLTAQSVSSYNVRAGSLTWASGGVQVGVSSAIGHPDYNSVTIDNDIAILKLAEPIEETDVIGYVTLPEEGQDPVAGSIATVAGWGLLSETGGGLSPSLQKVSIPVVSREVCQTQYLATAITDNMFCAGLEEGGKDSCSSDSGGPMVDESGTLIGVVSWGSGCARPEFSGVYARVGKYISFINNNAA